MVGITELMMDDRFAGWMEDQADDLLDSLSTYEVYSLFCNQTGETLVNDTPVMGFGEDTPQQGDTIN